MNSFKQTKSFVSSIEHLSHIDLQNNTTINDYKYSHTGQYLAIGDSDGYVHVYHRNKNNKMVQHSSIKIDQGAVLSVSWADPKFGYVLGVGTFSNKVFVYQLKPQGLTQIAHNQVHSASVNCVEWSSVGLKLYSGSSDGKVSILQCVKNTWKISRFVTGQSPIVSLALQPLSMGQVIAASAVDSFYPRIAVATKDMKIKIFAHKNQQFYRNEEQGKYFSNLENQRNNSGYSLIKEHITSKESIRRIIWRPCWGSINQSLESIQLIYGTEEGILRHIIITPNQKESIINTILQQEFPICNISQSLTGNLISVSILIKNNHQNYVYQEQDDNQWKLLQKSE